MGTLELKNSRPRVYAKAWAVFAVTLIFAATLNSTELSAAGSTSNCQGSGGQGQLSQYCDSSQSASQGSDVDSSLYKVWGGVATICTTACVSPNPAGQVGSACKWSDRAGAGTDAVATKSYSTALTSIATGQVSSQVSKSMSGGQQTSQNSSQQPNGTPTPKKPQSRLTSCVNAASSTMQAVSKYKSAKSASQSAAANTSAAKDLASSDTAVSNDPNEKSSGATAGGEESGRGGLSENQSGATAAINSASICATASATGQAAATIQCAVANDPTLPAYVATPQFLNDYKAATGGQDFSNFGSDPNQDAASAIGQAASGGLDGNTATQVAVAMRTIGGGQAPSYESAPYVANGGGASAPAAANDANDMTKVAQALMEQMQGGPTTNNQQASQSGIQAVAFANQTRSPASIPEDKTLSIFDRVTYRYLYTTKVLGMENSR